jgi:predicted CopG family antitoxin
MPKGYVNISVRVEVYEQLEELKNTLKYTSMSDLLTYLVRLHEDYMNALSTIMGTLEELKKILIQPKQKQT